MNPNLISQLCCFIPTYFRLRGACLCRAWALPQHFLVCTCGTQDVCYYQIIQLLTVGKSQAWRKLWLRKEHSVVLLGFFRAAVSDSWCAALAEGCALNWVMLSHLVNVSTILLSQRISGGWWLASGFPPHTHHWSGCTLNQSCVVLDPSLQERHGGTGKSPEKTNRADENSGPQVW